MVAAGRIRVIALTLVAGGVALAAGEPGDLDTGFGDGGVASIAVPFVPGSYATVYRDAVRQSGGRTVLVGSQTGAQHAWYACAVDAAGETDSAFGNGGTVIFHSGAVAGQVFDAAVDSQGRVLLCGSLSLQVVQGRKTTTVAGLALTRLTESGALDTAFGNGGLVFDALADFAGIASPRAQWTAVQADGRIVVAGDVVRVRKGSFTNTACLVVRYLANGQRDASFGTGGVLIDDLSPAADGVSSGLAVDGSGRLLVGAYSATYGDVLSRYQGSGALDTAFGSAGRVFPGPSMRHVSIDDQDRVVVCGGELGQGAVARYTVAGDPDSSFGDAGLLADPGIDFFFETAFEPDGALLLSGYRDAGVRSITRVLPDGTLDDSFGTDGHAEGPVASTTGGHCPVLVGTTTVAFAMGSAAGTYGSPWYVTQFSR